MISLDQLDVFSVVAKHMSFTRAAEELGVTQPAITRRIEHLEGGLGKPLFERRPGRLGLTPAGSTVLPYAQALHEIGRKAMQALVDLEAEPAGVLRVAAPSMLMARYILPFRALYPDIVLELRRGTYEEMINGLLDGDTDVGVFPMAAADPRLNASPFPGLDREPLVAVVPPGHGLAGHSRVSLAELSQEPLVMRGGMFLRELVEEWAALRGGTLHVVAEAPSSDDVKQLVLAGVGLGVLPWMGVEQDVRAGRLKAMELEDGSLTIGLYVISARGRPQSAATRRFLDFILTVPKIETRAAGESACAEPAT